MEYILLFKKNPMKLTEPMGDRGVKVRIFLMASDFGQDPIFLKFKLDLWIAQTKRLDLALTTRRWYTGTQAAFLVAGPISFIFTQVLGTI